MFTRWKHVRFAQESFILCLDDKKNPGSARILFSLVSINMGRDNDSCNIAQDVDCTNNPNGQQEDMDRQNDDHHRDSNSDCSSASPITLPLLPQTNDDDTVATFLTCANNDDMVVSMSSNMIPFESIKSQIRPLDLLFVRTSGIIGKTIRWGELAKFGDGNWTHVGVIVNKRVLPELQVEDADVDRLYLWECTISSNAWYATEDMREPDIESGEHVWGVQIRDLETMIKLMNKDPSTRIAWAPLAKHPLDQRMQETDEQYEQRKKRIIKTITMIHTRYLNRHYQTNPFAMLAVLFTPFRWIRDYMWGNPGMLFCSKFVTILFVALGMIDKNIDPDNISPTELANAAISPEYKRGMLRQLVKTPIYIQS